MLMPWMMFYSRRHCDVPLENSCQSHVPSRTCAKIPHTDQPCIVKAGRLPRSCTNPEIKKSNIHEFKKSGAQYFPTDQNMMTRFTSTRGWAVLNREILSFSSCLRMRGLVSARTFLFGYLGPISPQAKLCIAKNEDSGNEPVGSFARRNLPEL